MDWPRSVLLSSVHSFIWLSVCYTQLYFQIVLIGLRGGATAYVSMSCIFDSTDCSARKLRVWWLHLLFAKRTLQFFSLFNTFSTHQMYWLEGLTVFLVFTCLMKSCLVFPWGYMYCKYWFIWHHFGVVLVWFYPSASVMLKLAICWDRQWCEVIGADITSSCSCIWSGALNHWWCLCSFQCGTRRPATWAYGWHGYEVHTKFSSCVTWQRKCL